MSEYQKRLMQKEIQGALALRLLQGEFTGGDAVTVDAADDGLVFRKT